MTTASIERCYDHYIIEIYGHAGAEGTLDPACAAASTLAFTLDAWLTERYLRGELSRFEKSAEEGSMYFDVLPRDDELFSAGLEVITQGFDIIAEKWPDNVSIEY